MRRLKVLMSGSWLLGLVVSGWGLLMFSSAARVLRELVINGYDKKGRPKI